VALQLDCMGRGVDGVSEVLVGIRSLNLFPDFGLG
jgi:hypothetical protein